MNLIDSEYKYSGGEDKAALYKIQQQTLPRDYE
jgi:hypothetical protein